MSGQSLTEVPRIKISILFYLPAQIHVQSGCTTFKVAVEIRFFGRTLELHEELVIRVSLKSIGYSGHVSLIKKKKRHQKHV